MKGTMGSHMLLMYKFIMTVYMVGIQFITFFFCLFYLCYHSFW